MNHTIGLKEISMAQALTLEQKKEKALAVRSTADRLGTGTERKRNVFNGTEGKLTIEHQIEGYHLHIFNDSPGRIASAQSGGYEFVSPDEVGGTRENVVSRNTDVGDKVRFLVGRSEDGKEPQYAYLMKVKQEWYEEDQQAVQAKVNATDDAIRNGKASSESTEGFYTPKNGIKMNHSNKF